MCEPHHSIIQWPNDQDGSHLGCVLGPLIKLGKTIGGYLNVSKMGKGHSEALEKIRCLSTNGEHTGFLLPPKMDYEVAWWNRTIHIDNGFKFSHFEGKPVPMDAAALDSATQYAHLTSIGNLHVLRQFLTQTIRSSDRPYTYLGQFNYILNKRGQVQFDKHYRSIQKTRRKESLINFLCGFTRKRQLLVSEWADDSSVWKAV